MIAAPKLEFAPILPELFLCGVAILGLLYEAIAPKAERLWHLALAFAGLIAAALATFPLWHWDGPPTVMRGMVSVDRFSVVSRLLLLGIAGMGLLFGTHYFARSGDAYRGEFYPLILFATAGMTLITAAADLILVFLALEILSLALYVLTGITGRRNSNEAAMKYFLLGAFSSAFFLFGVAWAYGATGTTSITAIANALAGQTGDQALALLAFVFLAIGFGFKVSAVPFHQWTPDVYQGAPTPVTAFMSAATKVAAFLALIRVLDVAFQPLTWDWTPVIWVLAAASVILGQRARDRAIRHQADAGVLQHRPRRLHPHGADVVEPDRHPRGDVLPGLVRADDARRVRGRHARLGERGGADVAHRVRRALQAEPAPGRAHDAVPALAGRHPAHGRVRGQGGRVHRGDPRRAHSARAGRESWRASWRHSSTSA